VRGDDFVMPVRFESRERPAGEVDQRALRLTSFEFREDDLEIGFVLDSCAGDDGSSLAVRVASESDDGIRAVRLRRAFSRMFLAIDVGFYIDV